jgi:XrtJ-associated TM-motif-TM protein
MKKTFLLLAGFALLSFTIPVHAQDGPSGCEESPENPTAILAVVGSAGVLLSSLRARIKTRNDSEN